MRSLFFSLPAHVEVQQANCIGARVSGAHRGAREDLRDEWGHFEAEEGHEKGSIFPVNGTNPTSRIPHFFRKDEKRNLISMRGHSEFSDAEIPVADPPDYGADRSWSGGSWLSWFRKEEFIPTTSQKKAHEPLPIAEPVKTWGQPGTF